MVRLLASEVQQLLHNKYVVVLGDSVHRAVYKNLVLLMQKDCLLTYKQLRTKGELSFEKDQLMKGGLLDTKSACVTTPTTTRYGRNSLSTYKQNLENLFGRMHQVLPKSCLLVWNTAMPLGDKIRVAFLPQKCKGQARISVATLQKSVRQANLYSHAEATKRYFDVLDLNFHFCKAKKHLQGDGCTGMSMHTTDFPICCWPTWLMPGVWSCSTETHGSLTLRFGKVQVR
ncbi:hypothetical protein HispidOSU_006551 [Sigmodon hispidus]